MAAQLCLSEGRSRAAYSLPVARERDDGGNEHGHLLDDLSLMHDLGVRRYVQVPRKRSNVFTPALAASTTNLLVVLAGGI